MTDADAWEAHCAAGQEPPFICHDCGAAIDPTDHGEIDAHRDEHWTDYLRSHCPIPSPPIPERRTASLLIEDNEEVPL